MSLFKIRGGKRYNEWWGLTMFEASPSLPLAVFFFNLV
jgi:hypothetical protein